MRNPIRLKNLRLRYWPYYVAGLAVVVLRRPEPPAFAVGALLVMMGALIRTWGAGHLVKNDQMTITGPYAWVRHPLYVGTLLTATGFAIIVGGWLTVGLLVVILPWFFLVYFPRKERSEGARLESLYGGDFRRYREHVRALWPRLSPWHPDPATLEDTDPTLRWSGACYSDNNELGTLLAQMAGLGVLAARTFDVF